MYYVVAYEGPFGFIKPWTAVRDKATYSQQFLTPSTVEGMRQKLGVQEILRHRLTYLTLSRQQEVTQTKAWKYNTKTKTVGRANSILDRHVLIEPTLYLAFSSQQDAERAHKQHLCLCRNEDIVYPVGEVQKLTEDEFNRLNGFELRFEKAHKEAFMVGYNRYADNAPMYGWLDMTDKPLKNDE